MEFRGFHRQANGKGRAFACFTFHGDVTAHQGLAYSHDAAGRALFVYTCNTPRNVRRALAAGATGVISDRPGWLAAYMEREIAPDGA